MKPRSRWRWVKTGDFWTYPSKLFSIQLYFSKEEKRFEGGIWPRHAPSNRVLFIESEHGLEVKHLLEIGAKALTIIWSKRLENI